MHGLVNRSIQRFVCDSYGRASWLDVIAQAGIEFNDFEAMLTYKEAYTPRLLDAASEVLKLPRADIMEDIGTFLVSHPGFEAVRRLLRFGGVDFVDFLHSLDELPDRARLAVSDLHLPKVELRTHDAHHFTLICAPSIEGYGRVMMGILRVMADDYGVLALLEHSIAADGAEEVGIKLVEVDFAEGRSFELGARLG